jgi:hypothetical protein
MVTVEQIKAEFTAFKNTSDELIAYKIADAYAQFYPGGWAVGSYDQAVKYQTCHLLACEPGGEFARLDPNKEPDGATTLYERRLNQLQQSSVVAAMVV